MSQSNRKCISITIDRLPMPAGKGRTGLALLIARLAEISSVRLPLDWVMVIWSICPVR